MRRLVGNLKVLTLALVFLTTTNTTAQTWESILELSGSANGANRSLIVDPLTTSAYLPNLIVTGKTLDPVDSMPEKLHRLHQPMPDQEGLLEGLDVAGQTIFSLAMDRNGALYSAGDYRLNTAQSAWLIRRSGDGGSTWSTVRDFTLGGSTAQARGLTVTEAGTIVVCGFAFDAGNYSHWIVQTSSDGGYNWNTQDLFRSTRASSLSTGENMVWASGVAEAAGPNGGLFVVGSRGNGSAGLWTVLRSRDGGQSWQTKDSWLPSSRGSSRARKVTVDALGRIFVLGDAGSWDESWISPWVVRMSADGGETWKTIFGPWHEGRQPVPWDLTVDSAGNVWIAGQILREYPVSKRSTYYLSTATVVQLRETVSGAWNYTVHAVSPECPDNGSASAASITADAAGHVYVNGTYRTSSTTPRTWFVKRFTP
ncbi:MAG TPA: sialidase family protein [Methylomirabilota bacterium]|nr:sialidase family protein [Methylomirabilota bacterium]